MVSKCPDTSSQMASSRSTLISVATTSFFHENGMLFRSTMSSESSLTAFAYSFDRHGAVVLPFLPATRDGGKRRGRDTLCSDSRHATVSRTGTGDARGDANSYAATGMIASTNASIMRWSPLSSKYLLDSKSRPARTTGQTLSALATFVCPQILVIALMLALSMFFKFKILFSCSHVSSTICQDAPRIPPRQWAILSTDSDWPHFLR